MEPDYIEECPHCKEKSGYSFDVGWGISGYTEYMWECDCHNEHCTPERLHDCCEPNEHTHNGADTMSSDTFVNNNIFETLNTLTGGGIDCNSTTLCKNGSTSRLIT